MLYSRLNIAFAVCCCFSLACGIVCSAVISKSTDFIMEQDSDLGDLFTGAWTVGLAYIIPGALGLLATALRKNAIYLTHFILGLTSVIVLAILFFRGTVQVQQSGAVDCEGQKGTCTCRGSQSQALLKLFSCNDINYLERMGIASDAMLLVGGIVTFISAFMSVVLGNRLVNIRPQQRNAPSSIDLSEINLSGTQHHFNESPRSEDLNTQLPESNIQYSQPIFTSVQQAFVSLFKN